MRQPEIPGPVRLLNRLAQLSREPAQRRSDFVVEDLARSDAERLGLLLDRRGGDRIRSVDDVLDGLGLSADDNLIQVRFYRADGGAEVPRGIRQGNGGFIESRG